MYKLFAKWCNLTGLQNPRWPPSDFGQYLTFDLDWLESRAISLDMGCRGRRVRF